MQEIVWLSHGGPGSGRYPKGSGKKREIRKNVKRLNKLSINYQIKKHEYNTHFGKASKLAFKMNTKDLSLKKVID